MEVYHSGHSNMFQLNIIQISLLESKNSVLNFKIRNMIIFILECAYFQGTITLKNSTRLKALKDPNPKIHGISTLDTH